MDEAILKYALGQLVLEWQGVWKDLGRFLGQLSPSKSWKFTPEETGYPGKLTCHKLIERCLAYPSENQRLLVLYWVLACAYGATGQYSRKNIVETGTQTPATAILSVLRKKQWMKKTMDPYCQIVKEEEEEERSDQEAGGLTND